MIISLNAFCKALQDILAKNIHTIQEIFDLTQDVFNLLQKSINDRTMRKSIILLEGSIMHLSYTHLLAQLFAKTIQTTESKKSYSKQDKNNIPIQALKTLYSQSLFSLINECKKAIEVMK